MVALALLALCAVGFLGLLVWTELTDPNRPR